MLLLRSILIQLGLILTITLCYGQDHDYSVEESDESGYHDGDEYDHPDYSKYYSVDTSAPLESSPETSGQSSPIEYQNFFSPIEFGESQNKEKIKSPFVKQENQLPAFASSNKDEFSEFYSGSPYDRDYFEEAQKQQNSEDQNENYEGSSEPGYISHNIPYEKENYETATSNYDFPEKYTNYGNSQASSPISQYPRAPGQYAKLTQSPTPYQKYSFQPVNPLGYESKFLSNLVSTIAPFNPAYSKIVSTTPTPAYIGEPSENVPSNLKGKNCKRVKKDVNSRGKREAMTCFVCEDPGIKSKYTQCSSYTKDPNPLNYYNEESSSYSSPTQSHDAYRKKRYTNEEYTDPYEYVKARSQSTFVKPEATNEYQEFKYPSYYDTVPDKSFSEIQSDELKKSPGNCQKVDKDGMTCTICKDPKTGGNFEQCSYTSEPKEKKFAYVTEKKYDSIDDPEEKAESKPNKNIGNLKEAVEKYNPKEEYQRFQEKNDKFQKKLINDEPYQIPKHFVESTAQISQPKSDDRYPQTSSENKYSQPNSDNRYSQPNSDNRYSQPNSGNQYSQPNSDNRYSQPNSGNQYSQPNSDNRYSQPNSGNQYSQSNSDNRYSQPNSQNGYSQSNSNNRYSEPKSENQYSQYNSNDKYSEPRSENRNSNPVDRYSQQQSENKYDSSRPAAEQSSPQEKSQAYKDIDEYSFKLFPEYSREESKQEQVLTGNPANVARKDVAQVLAEFSKKDRSSCKKAERNGMTCYLCVNKNGAQQEECMYVSESKPQASHLAYHEVKQITEPKRVKEIEKEQIPAPSEPKRKKFFKKVNTESPFTSVEAASDEIEEKIARTKAKPLNNSRRKVVIKQTKEPVSSSSNADERADVDDDNEPTQETPVEFQVGDEEGAFSAETKPVYSKTLGVKLPKYMLEKSEFEQEFDDFSGRH